MVRNPLIPELPQRWRLRNLRGGREVVLAAEPGVRYIDRDSGEELEVTRRLLPLAPSPSRLPWSETNLRFCPSCEQPGKSHCPYDGRPLRHSPFERPARNVEAAARKRGLEFPIGFDNDYQAWHAYGNRYWPSQYLVDSAGHVRYTHVGEGSYPRTEAAIRALVAQSLECTPEASEAART